MPTKSTGAGTARGGGKEIMAEESGRAGEGHRGPQPGPVEAVSSLLPGGLAEGRGAACDLVVTPFPAHRCPGLRVRRPRDASA